VEARYFTAYAKIFLLVWHNLEYQEATAETHSELSSEFSSGTEHTSVHTDGSPTANSRKDLLKE